jgi:hypothetical protein
MSEKIKDKHLKGVSYLFLSLMTVGLIGCTPSSGDPFTDFNTEYAPEYQLNSTHLMVNWQGNTKRGVEPLKLKIPVAYLMHAVDAKGRLKTMTWALHPMEKGQINKISLEVSYSNGAPVPYYYQEPSDTKAITEKKMKFFSDGYLIHIFTDKYTSRVNEKMPYLHDNEFFRGKDESGLERYVEMKCYDIEELKTNVFRLKLEELAIKKPYDDMPTNCLPSSYGSEYWVSPMNTPQEKAVKIYYGTAMSGYQMNLVYKGHLIVIVPLRGAQEIVKNWKYYHQQVTQLLDSMVLQ